MVININNNNYYYCSHHLHCSYDDLHWVMTQKWFPLHFWTALPSQWRKDIISMVLFFSWHFQKKWWTSFTCLINLKVLSFSSKIIIIIDVSSQSITIFVSINFTIVRYPLHHWLCNGWDRKAWTKIQSGS